MQSLINCLLECLDKMDVPKIRKEITIFKQPSLHNLKWLQRNLFVRNSQHHDFPTAKHFVNHLLFRENEFVD